jgi:hypothetical protein
MRQTAAFLPPLKLIPRWAEYVGHPIEVRFSAALLQTMSSQAAWAMYYLVSNTPHNPNVRQRKVHLVRTVVRHGTQPNSQTFCAFNVSRERTATVLQPGRYTPVRSGQADSTILRKHLQISILTGRANTGWNTPGATENHGVPGSNPGPATLYAPVDSVTGRRGDVRSRFADGVLEGNLHLRRV